MTLDTLCFRQGAATGMTLKTLPPVTDPRFTEVTYGPLQHEQTRGPLQHEQTRGPLQHEQTLGPLQHKQTCGPLCVKKVKRKEKHIVVLN